MKHSLDRLREALPMDIEGLINLEQACFSQDCFEKDFIAELLMDEEASVWLCPGGNEVQAALYVIWKPDWARLFSVAVAPQMQGRGLGRALVAKAEMEARSRGYKELRLELRPDNLTAVALYERCGFQRLDCLNDFYEDGAQALQYIKPLL